VRVEVLPLRSALPGAPSPATRGRRGILAARVAPSLVSPGKLLNQSQTNRRASLFLSYRYLSLLLQKSRYQATVVIDLSEHDGKLL